MSLNASDFGKLHKTSFTDSAITNILQICPHVLLANSRITRNSQFLLDAIGDEAVEHHYCSCVEDNAAVSRGRRPRNEARSTTWLFEATLIGNKNFNPSFY